MTRKDPKTCERRHNVKLCWSCDNTLSTLDHRERTKVYVNVGAWQNGHSDFALISGPSIAICTWGNFMNEAHLHDESEDNHVRIEGVCEPRCVRNPKDKWLSKSGKIKEFLGGAPLGPGQSRYGRAMVGYTAPGNVRFTAEGELIVLFGDCHVHLFKSWVCDNFVKPTAGDTGDEELAHGYFRVRESLIRDFVSFITYAREFASQSSKDVEIIQLGDLYEVWEVQGMFELAYQTFEMMRGGDKELAERRFDDSLLSFPSRFRERRNELPCDWAALADYWDLGHHPECYAERWAKAATPSDVIAMLVHRYGGRVLATEDRVGWFGMADSVEKGWWNPPIRRLRTRNEPLDFRNDAAVISAIQKEYKHQVPVDFWKSFTGVRGNHDTEAPNRHIERHFGSSTVSVTETAHSDPAQSVAPPTGGAWAGKDYWPPNGVAGRKNARGKRCIWYEHGHAFDPFNNDSDYWRSPSRLSKALERGVRTVAGAGYHLTKGWLVGELLHPTGKYLQVGGQMQDLKAHTGTNGVVGRGGLVRYTEERARYILEHEAHVRLVALGHSHVPTLYEYTYDGATRRVETISCPTFDPKKAWIGPGHVVSGDLMIAGAYYWRGRVYNLEDITRMLDEDPSVVTRGIRWVELESEGKKIGPGLGGSGGIMVVYAYGYEDAKDFHVIHAPDLLSLKGWDWDLATGGPLGSALKGVRGIGRIVKTMDEFKKLAWTGQQLVKNFGALASKKGVYTFPINLGLHIWIGKKTGVTRSVGSGRTVPQEERKPEPAAHLELECP